MSAALAVSEPDSGGARLIRRILGFLRLLRENGFPLGIGEGRDALRLLRGRDMADRDGLRWSLRALLCASRADWRRFDELFDAYWLRRGMKRGARVAGSNPRAAPTGPAGEGGATSSLPTRSERGADFVPGGGEGRRGGASAVESLTEIDLRHINDPEDMARVAELAERLAARMRYRLTRRERQRRSGRRLDLRKVIHNSVRYGGTPLQLSYRRRWPKPLKLVVILDASGSMSNYSAFFVRFLRGVLDQFREADAFVFHTRLIHISEVLRERDAEKALERMSLMASGWAGGTRIGESLAAFNRNYARTAITSRTAVIIVSDGYDTGPADRLAEEMRLLKRRAKRIVWLNPMIAWRDYEPLAGGMAAALPFIDLFAPAHNLRSLAALEPYLAKL
jgi:uncharacterized protein with von Willebrand factor type A (vWA) domain